MSTVYIINEPHKNPRGRLVTSPYDVSPAAEHGSVEFIFPGKDFPSPSEDIERAVEHAWEVLENFNAEEDYIVWAGGDPISMLIVAPILYDIAGDGVRYLKFERSRSSSGDKMSSGRYLPRTVTLFDEDRNE